MADSKEQQTVQVAKTLPWEQLSQRSSQLSNLQQGPASFHKQVSCSLKHRKKMNRKIDTKRSLLNLHTGINTVALIFKSTKTKAYFLKLNSLSYCPKQKFSTSQYCLKWQPLPYGIPRFLKKEKLVTQCHLQNLSNAYAKAFNKCNNIIGIFWKTFKKPD